MRTSPVRQGTTLEVQGAEKVIIGSVVGAIAAFLNSDGDTLVIGMDDHRNVLGIEPDLAAKKSDCDILTGGFSPFTGIVP